MELSVSCQSTLRAPRRKSKVRPHLGCHFGRRFARVCSNPGTWCNLQNSEARLSSAVWLSSALPQPHSSTEPPQLPAQPCSPSPQLSPGWSLRALRSHSPAFTCPGAWAGSSSRPIGAGCPLVQPSSAPSPSGPPHAVHPCPVSGLCSIRERSVRGFPVGRVAVKKRADRDAIVLLVCKVIGGRAPVVGECLLCGFTGRSPPCRGLSLY